MGHLYALSSQGRFLSSLFYTRGNWHRGGRIACPRSQLILGFEPREPELLGGKIFSYSLESISVSMGCCDIILGDWNSKKLFLLVLEARYLWNQASNTVGIMVKAFGLLYRDIFLYLDIVKTEFWLIHHLLKALISCMKAPPSWPNYFLKTPSLNTITFWI
jgi:hypothetical protein